MRFVGVSQLAVEQLTADRFLQSCEFDEGDRLSAALTNGLTEPTDFDGVKAVGDREGLWLLRGPADPPDAIVFDLSTADLFRSRPRTEALLVFQKVLRFALRYWGNQKFASSARMIPGSSKAVVFPFPISTKSSYRVVVETAPDSKRAEKRPQAGRCLLVFRDGLDEGAGVAQEPSLTVFRKALAKLDSVRAAIPPHESRPVDPTAAAMSLTRLGPLPSVIDGHIGFDAWRQNLTSAQRSFVDTPLTSPHRLEGPAGSGKTICLVLKTIALLKRAEMAGVEQRSLFVAHSEAVRRTIQGLFEANDPAQYAAASQTGRAQFVKVTTLHELCGELLGRDIAESEFLDRDALESKNAQLLYVDEVIAEAWEKDLQTYRAFISREFAEFVDSADRWLLAQLVQHEISVVIKGRADENLEKYKTIPRPPTGLPLTTESDRGFVYMLFQRYQERLSQAAAFDTDDVVLSALGQLNTPIWRRRRAREGFDSIFVDETHLFNLNELSVFHHLTRSDRTFPIAYSADLSQSLEDRGWTDDLLSEALKSPDQVQTATTRVESVFRCSPDIVDLALSITTAGATLFRNFDNSLRSATSAFTAEEERLATKPLYVDCSNDEDLVRTAFSRAEIMAGELGGRAKVAIIVFDERLWAELKRFASDGNKPVEYLAQRGDIEVVHRAQRSQRFVLSMPDYVGGLEFGGVVLAGVDQGRVPASPELGTGTAAFLTYQAHSRLYVAITRARYRAEILGTLERGPSGILMSAFERGALGRYRRDA